MAFRNRTEAGRALSAKLLKYADRSDVVVLGLPRGGVPVAFEVARALHAPLDVFVVRKIGVPGHEELAMGAAASGKIRVINQEIVDAFAVPDSVIAKVTAREEQEIDRRERLYREKQKSTVLVGKTLILVDDGLATGSTMRAAVYALRSRKPARLIVAVPVAAAATCAEFRDEVEEIVCAETPEPFYAVSQSYEEFTQTSDDEVRDFLNRAAKPNVSAAARPEIQ